MFLYLRKPRPISANPPNPRGQSSQAAASSSYPDYEQSFVLEEVHEPENNHVISIDI